MFRKLLRSFSSGSDGDRPRQPSTVGDLIPGDLLSFKQRLSLPEEMQGETYEVSAIGTYQFEDGLYLQITLVATNRSKVYLGFNPNEPQGELCFSKPVTRSQVLELFGEENFSNLWKEGFARLDTRANDNDANDNWLTSEYAQVKNSAIGFYFERDVRGEHVSDRQDDNSEELRYHECEGSDDRFGLTVEVWGDGDTEVTLDVYTPADVVDSIFPAS